MKPRKSTIRMTRTRRTWSRPIEVTYRVADDFGNIAELTKTLYVVRSARLSNSAINGYIRYVDKDHIDTVDPDSNWGEATYNAKLREALDNLENGTNPGI